MSFRNYPAVGSTVIILLFFHNFCDGQILASMAWISTKCNVRDIHYKKLQWLNSCVCISLGDGTIHKKFVSSFYEKMVPKNLAPEDVKAFIFLTLGTLVEPKVLQSEEQTAKTWKYFCFKFSKINFIRN